MQSSGDKARISLQNLCNLATKFLITLLRCLVTAYYKYTGGKLKTKVNTLSLLRPEVLFQSAFFSSVLRLAHEVT